MTDEHDNYENPLSARYASEPMCANFSNRKKFATWRRLWIVLAEAEQKLGLPIDDEQLAEMRAAAEEIDFERAAAYERELRHDVMAHVRAFGDQCPKARGIIHLGATSCFVGDNTDLVLLRDGLDILRRPLVSLIARLRDFAERWRSLPTLGLTHYQPAQATTVGKRACLWLNDLVDDLAELDHQRAAIRFRGVKGATGSQASFLALFDGDGEKVRELDALVTTGMGFERTFGVTGQTYPRKVDFRVCQVLSGIAQSAYKFASDIRLLSNRRELSEPFEGKQVGSSAMPWKRNPMRSERICALGRFVIESLGNTAHTAANQWLERTLDDSANRRLSLGEMFLATDAILHLYLNVVTGLDVNEAVVGRNLALELPFLASEHILMEAVKSGADRQAAHESLRVHSIEATRDVNSGGENTMRRRIAEDPQFAPLKDRLEQLLDGSQYVGRAPDQVLEFLAAQVDPVLERYADLVGAEGEVRV